MEISWKHLKSPNTGATMPRKAKVTVFFFFRPTVLHDHTASRLVKKVKTQSIIVMAASCLTWGFLLLDLLVLPFQCLVHTPDNCAVGNENCDFIIIAGVVVVFRTNVGSSFTFGWWGGDFPGAHPVDFSSRWRHYSIALLQCVPGMVTNSIYLSLLFIHGWQGKEEKTIVSMRGQSFHKHGQVHWCLPWKCKRKKNCYCLPNLDGPKEITVGVGYDLYRLGLRMDAWGGLRAGGWAGAVSQESAGVGVLGIARARCARVSVWNKRSKIEVLFVHVE